MILSNRFNVLLEVPLRPVIEPTGDEILARCRCLYSAGPMVAVEEKYADARPAGGTRQMKGGD